MVTPEKPRNGLVLSPSSAYSSSTQRGGGSSKRRIHVKNPVIKIIDFGGATFEGDHHTSIINTRQYRGPEVILGLGWDSASDMWSAGCILSELLKGRLLFETHDNHEHLALMQISVRCQWMVRGSRQKSGNKYFDDGAKLYYPTSL